MLGRLPQLTRGETRMVASCGRSASRSPGFAGSSAGNAGAPCVGQNAYAEDSSAEQLERLNATVRYTRCGSWRVRPWQGGRRRMGRLATSVTSASRHFHSAVGAEFLQLRTALPAMAVKWGPSSRFMAPITLDARSRSITGLLPSTVSTAGVGLLAIRLGESVSGD